MLALIVVAVLAFAIGRVSAPAIIRVTGQDFDIRKERERLFEQMYETLRDAADADARDEYIERFTQLEQRHQQDQLVIDHLKKIEMREKVVA